MSSRCWTLSPSDFALLWDECPRCFYLKVVLGFPRPRPLAPKIFSLIEERMRAGWEGRRTETLAADVPPVTRLRLLAFEPETFACEAAGQGRLTGALSWVEFPRDDGLLFGFLAEVLPVLERPAPPGGAPLCGWCVYRDASRRTGL